MTTAGTELFISDLHLAPDTPAVATRFLRFIATTARQARHLTILGDLFDSWAGDDDLADPFNASIVTGLRELVAAGVRVDLMVGNRDFLIGEAFAAAAAVTLLPDPSLREIHGMRTVLTHGDLLCTDDADYQHFRSEVRKTEWCRAFLARPLTVRKREIESLRARSEVAKRSKPAVIMDVNATAVTALMREHGVAALIHGHTHRPGQHVFRIDDRDCQRWVLGDWHPEHGNALTCGATGCRWLDLS